MILVVVIAYAVGMIWIGLGSARRIKTIESFFIADRKGTSLFITGSLLATIVGGSSTVGMAGKGFSWGIVGAWWMLVGVVGLLLLSVLLAKRIRNYGLFTLPELLERQYGVSLKLLASVVIIWAWLGIIGGQIVAAGRILNTMVPGSLSLLMVLSAAVFMAYTILGGQISIIRTDAIQSGIMIGGILLCAYFGLERVGGLTAMKGHVPQDHFLFPINSYFSWKNLIEWLVLIGSAYLVGPDIYSRLFSSRDGETAQRSVLVTALILIPLAFSIALIGMYARVLNPSIMAEESFPYIIREVLPQGVNAIVLAALLCAIMSSADTVLLTASTIFSMDIVNEIVKKTRHKALDEGQVLLLSRLTVILFGLVALGFALKSRGVISLLLFGYSVYTGGLVVPVVFGFYRQRLRLNLIGAMTAMIGGGGWVLFSQVTPRIRTLLESGSKPYADVFPWDQFLQLSPGFQGVLISLILLFGVSSIFRARNRNSGSDHL
jgi:SSS family solute:Na+ symporter